MSKQKSCIRCKSKEVEWQFWRECWRCCRCGLTWAVREECKSQKEAIAHESSQ
jgi:hypothetical protein